MAYKESYYVKKTRYGTPTGTVTMPATLHELDENVKDSITIEESSPTIEKIRTEQGNAPRRVVAKEPGEMKFTCEYHDLSYATLAALKGGTATAAVPGTSAANWKPGETFEVPVLAWQAETDSGEYYNFYNALIVATIGGSGSRAGYFKLKVEIYPQTTADGAGSWEIRDVTVPSA